MEKKKILLLISCAVFGLACLSTAAAGRLDAGEGVELVPTVEKQILIFDDGAAATVPTLVPGPRCAVVVAEVALHMRKGSTVHDDVMTWLIHGDVIELLDDANPEWWRVRRGTLEGFARSEYLRESDCGG